MTDVLTKMNEFKGFILQVVAHFKSKSMFVSFYFLDKIAVLVANSNKEGINNVPSIDQYQCHAD